MSETVLCKSCGERMRVPDGHDLAGLGCPVCGIVSDLPAPTKKKAPICPECGERMRVTPGKPPRCRRCSATQIEAGASPWGVSTSPFPPVPAAPGPAIEATDEDDDKPYRLPDDPDPKEPCPRCKKLLPVGAVVCNHCGLNMETGTRLQRVHEEVDKQWEAGLRFSVRFGVFLAVQGLALAVTTVVAFADGNVLGLAISWMVGVTLLAFVLGTYPRINLTRNKRGQVRLTKTYRVCFISLGAASIRWREYEGVVSGQSHQTDIWDWLPVVFLFPWGVVPAVLWWLYVVEPDQFHAALSRDHGSPALLLYRGRSDKTAMEIATTVRKVTGLR